MKCSRLRHEPNSSLCYHRRRVCVKEEERNREIEGFGRDRRCVRVDRLNRSKTEQINCFAHNSVGWVTSGRKVDQVRR